MLKEYNNLSILRVQKMVSTINLVFSKDGRYSQLVYARLVKKLGVDFESQITISCKEFKRVYSYLNSVSFTSDKWLVTLSDVHLLNKSQLQVLCDSSNCVFFLEVDTYKNYYTLVDMLKLKHMASISVFNLGYLNPQLVYNLVNHFNLTDYVSTYMQKHLAYNYSQQHTLVYDMFERLSTSPQKVTKAYFVSELGYPLSSLKKVALYLVEYLIDLKTTGYTLRKQKNRLRKIFPPCKFYADTYSYRSLQTVLYSQLKAFIQVKTIYLRKEQRQYKVKSLKDRDLQFAFSVYDTHLRDLTLTYLVSILLKINEFEWENLEDFTLFLLDFASLAEVSL